jgi:excisionase family DNA binding protein
MNERLFTIPEAMARLGCGRTTIYELLTAGQLSGVKLGCKTLIRASELDRSVEALPVAEFKTNLIRRSRPSGRIK